MFPWNIAKSAEAMFSRWAVKRVCKFLLKKKLGQFLLGDIDIEQLDVQLSQGTIQLHDLALNVDFLNKKVNCIVLYCIVCFEVRKGKFKCLGLCCLSRFLGSLLRL